MFVLLDLEWIETPKKHLTQLSAMRVDNEWNATERIDLLTKIPPGIHVDPNHVGFGGYQIVQFADGMSECEVISRFSDWLMIDDQILVWADSNKSFLQSLWNLYEIAKEIPTIHVVSNRLKSAAKKENLTARKPYMIMEELGKKPNYPEHRAANDVDVLQYLFTRLPMNRPFPDKKPQSKAAQAKSKLSIRVKNSGIADRSGYNYIFAEGGAVFHRKGCRHCLNAKHLLGSVYYETAARDRRPCKICKPTPDFCKSGASKNVGTKVADPHIPILTNMLGGTIEYLRPSRVTGWCHYEKHPGALTVNVMKEHRCINKNCRYFQKNEDGHYWKALEEEARKKAQKKKDKEERKVRAIETEEKLRQLQETWQSYLQDMDSDMYIVRVAEETPSCFRVFYVSDNCFADGNRYLEFLKVLRQNYPRYHIILRHIRDVDGRFVTTDEYLSRPKNR